MRHHILRRLDRARRARTSRTPVHAVVLCITVATLTLLGHATTATADSRGNSSVDNKEIRWEDETKFDDARKWAHTAWNNKKYNLTTIKIAPDEWDTITDLEWRDENRSDVRWVGAWGGLPGADRIYLNKHFLDTGKKYGKKGWRRKAAAHELGHALGFNHKVNGTLMSKTIGYIPANARPTATDRKAYHDLWD